MSYIEIDPVIFNWAEKHNLTIYREYKDEEVRSVDLVNTNGKRYQLWIEPPEKGVVTVHAWDYKKKKIVKKAKINQLEEILEGVFEEVRKWMSKQ